MDKNYQISQVVTDDHSLLEILKLLQLVFPKSSKFSMEYLKWQYVENPVGIIVGFNAYYENVLAAHYAAMPIYMNIKGRKIKGLLSLNTATHPEHRGRKLFSILANETYQYAANNGFEFVIGVANANSTHGFLKNLGFHLVSPLTVKVGVGKIRLRGNYDFSRYWDQDLLKWRMKNPSACYYQEGNFFFSRRSWGAKDILGCLPVELVNTRFLTNTFIRPLCLYVGLGAELSNKCFFKLPSFVDISPFNLIFKDLKGDLPMITKESILFQLMDFDVV